jgi:hypothetical protein
VLDVAERRASLDATVSGSPDADSARSEPWLASPCSAPVATCAGCEVTTCGDDLQPVHEIPIASKHVDERWCSLSHR